MLTESTSHPSSSAASWSSFEEDAQSRTADKLLQALKDSQHGKGYFMFVFFFFL